MSPTTFNFIDGKLILAALVIWWLIRRTAKP